MEKGNNSIIHKSFQESPIKDQDQVQDQSSRSWIFQQNSGPVEADQDLDNEVKDNEVADQDLDNEFQDNEVADQDLDNEFQDNDVADQDLDDDVQDNEVTEGVGEQVRGPETVQSPPNDLSEENDDPHDLEISTHQIESIQKLIGK